MRPVVSHSWDAFWIWSGLPIGLGLVFMPPSMRLAVFAIAVLLETGHNLSPIVLAWTHRGLRRLVLARPRQYIQWPTAVVLSSLAVGGITSAGLTSYELRLPHQLFRLTNWDNPFPVLVWAYWLWLIYHFGMQWFGVLRLYQTVNGWRGRRYRDKGICLSLMTFGMAGLPALSHDLSVTFVAIGIFSINHWMTAIGLCSKVYGRWWIFVPGVLALGAIGFVWMFPTPNGVMIRAIPWIVSLRFGAGMAHFLYDRGIWKFSDPLVRETIGKELFS